MKNFLAAVFFSLLCTRPILLAQNVTLLGSLKPYPISSYIDIWSYETNGREYAFLAVTAGTYELSFNAINLPSGIYFARLSAGDQSDVIKMNLLK